MATATKTSTTAKGAQAYPLQWPTGWPRTKARTSSAFKMAGEKSLKSLRKELGLMSAEHVVISSDVPLRQDGEMRQDREPVDPGVAVYFHRNGQPTVIACDSYDLLRENVRAIAVTVEAMRTIERHGSKELSNRAFSGFKDLPAVAGSGIADPFAELQLPSTASEAEVKARHRELARDIHPDKGGGAAMTYLNLARDGALAIIRGRS